tara:strand:- start:545 stop:730 length:186 start_codon:yes stop_codon:yes gene_type:complete
MKMLIESLGVSVFVVFGIIYSFSHISGAVLAGLAGDVIDLILSLVIPGYGIFVTVDHIFFH